MKAVAYFNVIAEGDTIEELEANALEKAHEFLGEDMLLEIYEDYQIFETYADLAFVTCTKKYGALVSVCPQAADEEADSPSRISLGVKAYGNDVKELESDAVAQACLFFGEDAEIQLNKSYSVFRNQILSSSSRQMRYYASIYTYIEPKESSQ